MHLSPTSKLGYLSCKRGFLLYILLMPKDTQLDTLYNKFYCRTLQYQGDMYVSKYFNTPPPLKFPHKSFFTVQNKYNNELP